MNVLNKYNPDATKTTKSLHDDGNDDDDETDDPRNDDDKTDDSSTDDFPRDIPLGKTGKCKLNKEILKKYRTRNFKLDDSTSDETKNQQSNTDQFKTGTSQIKQVLPICSVNNGQSKKCTTPKFKTCTADKFTPGQNKFCNCTSKADDIETGNSAKVRCKSNESKSSKKKKHNVNKGQLKTCKAQKFTICAKDNFASDQSKICNCTSKTDDFEADQAKSNDSKTGPSKIKICKVNKELLKKCRAHNFKLNDFTPTHSKIDDSEPIQSKIDDSETANLTTALTKPSPKQDQLKTDDSKTGTSENKTSKVNKEPLKKRKESRKSRKSKKIKTDKTDNFARDQYKVDDFTIDESKLCTCTSRKDPCKTVKNYRPVKNTAKKYKTTRTKSITSTDDDYAMSSLTPADLHLPPVKYELSDHPTTAKYRDTCLEGDYGTRIYAWGDSLKEAFEQCGMALYSYMIDLDTVEIQQKVYIEAEADEVMVLLYRFLEELRYLYCTLPYFHCKKLVITTFSAKKNGCFIGCDCFGEDVKKGKHKYGKSVEGTQFKGMHIVNKPDYNRFEICCIINSSKS